MQPAPWPSTGPSPECLSRTTLASSCLGVKSQGWEGWEGLLCGRCSGQVGQGCWTEWKPIVGMRDVGVSGCGGAGS